MNIANIACLQAPEVVNLYALNVSPYTVRNAIRRRFEANRYVTDKKAVDVLLMKGWQEYQETMNVWKQPDHIYGILLENQGASRPPRTFLQKFYEGEWCLVSFRIKLFSVVHRQRRGCRFACGKWDVLESLYLSVDIPQSIKFTLLRSYHATLTFTDKYPGSPSCLRGTPPPLQ